MTKLIPELIPGELSPRYGSLQEERAPSQYSKPLYRSFCVDFGELAKHRSASEDLESLPLQFLHEEFDRWIVGQDLVKRVLSGLGFSHLKHRNANQGPKRHALLLGPAGTGKTRLAEVLTRALDVPYVLLEATQLNARGPHEISEFLLSRLLEAANGDASLAQNGIIVLDGVEQLAQATGLPDQGRDSVGAQHVLLRLLKGEPVRVGPRNVATANLMILALGRFAELDQVMAGRRRAGATTGSGSFLDDAALHILYQCGLLPEFAAGFPIRLHTDPLDEAMLARILVEPEDAVLGVFQRTFAASGARLTVTRAAARALAREASRRGNGSWGLRQAVEDVLLETLIGLQQWAGSTISSAVLEGEDYQSLRIKVTCRASV